MSLKHQWTMVRITPGFWGKLDHVGHALPLPKRLQAWLCDKADRSFGVPEEDL